MIQSWGVNIKWLVLWMRLCRGKDKRIRIGLWRVGKLNIKAWESMLMIYDTAYLSTLTGFSQSLDVLVHERAAI